MDCFTITAQNKMTQPISKSCCITVAAVHHAVTTCPCSQNNPRYDNDQSQIKVELHNDVVYGLHQLKVSHLRGTHG